MPTQTHLQHPLRRRQIAARYDVYELVISFWSDDEVARKSNGYVSDGSAWSKTGRKRPR